MKTGETMIDWKFPVKGEMPESDPYKRYLVVYTPWEKVNFHNGYVPTLTRYAIAEYYPADGTYANTPWHFDLCRSCSEKEIIAWADIGDAADFNRLFKKSEDGENVLDKGKMRGQPTGLKIALDREKVALHMARKYDTVWQFAEACGVSKARMYMILRQQRNVHPKTARKIAEALGVEIEDIIATREER